VIDNSNNTLISAKIESTANNLSYMAYVKDDDNNKSFNTTFIDCYANISAATVNAIKLETPMDLTIENSQLFLEGLSVTAIEAATIIEDDDANNIRINNITVQLDATDNATIISLDHIANANITNSQFKSDIGRGIIVNNSRDILVDNNYINVSSDYTVEVINSANSNVTNNGLYAIIQEGDASVEVIDSTASVHDNNILNSIVTITGNLTVYKPSDILAKVTDLKGNSINYGSVVISVNNEDYNASFVNGTATLTYTPQNMSDILVKAVYTSPNKLQISNNTTLEVSMIDTVAELTSKTALINQPITLTATVRDAMGNKVQNGIITFKDDDDEVLGQFDVSNGMASVNLNYPDVGVYNITAVYSDSNEYKSSTANATVIINRINMAVSGNLTVFTSSAVTVGLTYQNNVNVTSGSVEVKVNNKKQNVTFKNGVATFNYTPQNTANVNVTITYTSPDNFNVSEKSSLTVNKINTKITAKSVTLLINQTVAFNVSIKDALNNNVRDGNVLFADGNSNLLGNARVNNGTASINLSYADVGVYNITLSYLNSSTYNPSTAKSTITVNRIKFNITGNLTVFTSSPVTVRLTNQNNVNVTSGSVEVKVNNKKQNVNFKNGVATFNYTPQNTANVNVTITYTSPDNFNVVYGSSLKVNMIATSTSLTSKTALVNQRVTMTATIKDALNNNVRDGLVSFTDDNSKLLGTANVNNGTASINLSHSKAGAYNITASYSSSDTYKPSTKTATITVNQVNIAITGSLTVFTPSAVTVRLTNQNNANVTSGSVEVKVNNKKQNVNFKNGMVTFNHTPQNMNDVNITVTYTAVDGFTVNKTVKLKVGMIATKLTLTGRTALTNQPVTVTATVKDAMNNTVKDGIVTFTDSNSKVWGNVGVVNGNASVNISYRDVGAYNITAVYSNSTIYKSSSAKTKLTINKVNIDITGNLTVFTPCNITVRLTNQNNAAVTTGTLQVNANNQKQNISLKNGVATFTFKAQNTSKVNITAEYTSVDNFKVNKSVTLNVAKIATKLTISANNKAPRVNEKVKLTVTLKDNMNNLISNQRITATVNNKNYTITTNKTGSAAIEYVMNKNYKNVSVVVKYAGNTSYLATNNTLTLNRTFKLDMELLTGSFDAKPGDTVKLIAHLKDNGLDITGGQLVFKLNGMSLKDENNKAVAINIRNGLGILEYRIPDSLGARTHNLTAVYASTNYERVELTTPMTIAKYATHIDVNPLYTTSDKIVIRAQIVDQNNQALNKQTTINIKLNGKGYTYYTTNGTINYQINTTLTDGYYNVTIISGENGKYMGSTVKTVLVKSASAIKTNYINNPLNTKATVNSGDVKTGNAMSILTGLSTVKPGDRLKLIAHLFEDGVDVNGGQLVFKLNNMSLKDDKNKSVTVNVKDGLAILEYKIPDSLSARVHNLTAVYASSKYGRIELSTFLTTNKLNTHINAEPLYTKSNTSYVKAEIRDDKNQLINRITTVVIKVDGTSYILNNTNGKINFKIPTALSKGVHQITIITGENGKYLSSRLNTVVIRT
ncbi:MAG: Ig-like domain repeat protein, partial [Methanosphaera sp.]|nr:Ig-like domain repeat protein [Methanosphaera sp.]